MTKYFKAVFKDGTTLYRSSETRDYVAAWMTAGGASGFCSMLHHAVKHTDNVVAAEEITAKEYRAGKAATRS